MEAQIINSVGNDLPKAYDSNAVELKLYELWENSGFFAPEVLEKHLEENGYAVNKPFTITLPPPNANGNLHLGHTCGYSFQDCMGRFARMSGRPTLLLPGKDHASIQTEAVFTRILAEQGEDKWELGREEFWQRCYDFCMEKAESAQIQERRIGLTADWNRDFFTLDSRLTKVIYNTFYKLFEDGLAYRGKYLINQCPHCRTALADVDTERKEMRGIMAYIIYPFADEADNNAAEKAFGYRGIMVATTRPETMLGDTAVAVHPDDERFTDFIGKKVVVPFVNREIEIIADKNIDPETGAGALKVTPAHAQIDFEMGQEHGLEIVNVIDENGLMSGDIPEKYIGMDTITASKTLCADLKELGLLHKIENIKHDVTVCERCGTPIQPIISYQWFVNMEPLAKKALEALDSGKTEILPSGQQTALIHFFNNIKPWCISRQLWWGQRIPVWYSGGKVLHDWLLENEGKTVADWEKESGEKARGSGKAFATESMPEKDENWDGSAEDLWFEQEEDIFDTWFSSGQWPFSTLGGVDGEDFAKYYPTQVMETARDILFWWVARMMMLGIYRTGETPFSKVFLHGLIMAEDSSKMSKSKGNGVEPTDIFTKYGADALRLWYYSDALPGSNTPFQESKIKGGRNFVNKIWNASRFILMNIDKSEVEALNGEMDTLAELWKSTDELVDSNMEANRQHIHKMQGYYEEMKFHLGAEELREFFWGEFCDQWIEQVKAKIEGEKVGSELRISELGELLFLLKQNLKIMHPMMPYVTEAIWQELVKADLAKGLLMVEQV